jgi:23S rRNA G2445 N2-methylase RlmL
MPFERWVREEGPRFRGTIGLIVSNPPYGERGVMAREDPDDFYKEKRAYAYFMRRALDLLVPGGVGVFLVPAGFLSGNMGRGLREKLLRGITCSARSASRATIRRAARPCPAPRSSWTWSSGAAAAAS